MVLKIIFTSGLAWMIRRAPFIMPIPAGGQTRTQPLWVEDLVNLPAVCQRIR
jgi:hypothetical protein